MKGGHNHRLYPVLVSSDEDGQEEPTALHDREEDDETGEEDALVSSNNCGPPEPEIRMEPNSIYERRKAQVKLQRKWAAQRHRAKEKRRSSAPAVFKYSWWQRSAMSVTVGVIVGVVLVAGLLWNRKERLSGTCTRTCVCVTQC